MTDQPSTAVAEPDLAAADPTSEGTIDTVVEDVLVEEVSIDGMCGVY